MQARVFIYGNHDPDERFAVRAVESDHNDSWVLVEFPNRTGGDLQLGLTPDQARDLARDLVATAFDAELEDRRISLRQQTTT